MSDYRVFLTTCDKYLPILRPMAYLMDRYWEPMPAVVVGGFTPPDFPLPPSWIFHSIGKQDDYPFGKWSNAVIALVQSQPDDVFLLMLDDMWPVRTVDTVALDIAYHYCEQFHYVAKFDVCADRQFSFGALDYGHCNRLDLVKSMPGSPYHLSLMPGFWRKEHLLSALIPDESPHDVELIGTTRLSHNQNVIVVGTKNWPMRVTLALRGGDHSKLLLDEVDAEDARQMREMGLLKAWE